MVAVNARSLRTSEDEDCMGKLVLATSSPPTFTEVVLSRRTPTVLAPCAPAAMSYWTRSFLDEEASTTKLPMLTVARSLASKTPVPRTAPSGTPFWSLSAYTFTAATLV